MLRVFAISDLHVDYKQNMDWIKNLSTRNYLNDILLIAGDISDSLLRFGEALDRLASKFFKVMFVPGNHDLWVRKKEVPDSLQKFELLLDICSELGVATKAMTFKNTSHEIFIQPLFSWYVKPEEGDDSLFLKKPGEDESLSMWVDNYAIVWPDFNGYKNAAAYFHRKNSLPDNLNNLQDVITFSHFLPRQELIFGSKVPDEETMAKYKHLDPAPKFNFSRVAGNWYIDKQLRDLNSSMHLYGHQHRNRFAEIDGVTYVSHGLGYPKERIFKGIVDAEYSPLMIWNSETGFITHLQ